MTSPHLELLHYPPVKAARKAPPLLFVHGAYATAQCWAVHFLPWFAERGYDCWALSLEGHGESEGQMWLHALGIDQYVRNVASVCQRLPEPPVLIGHSMGGFIIQQLLRQQRAAGCILLASVPPTGLAGSTWRLCGMAPDILFGLNLFQQGQYQPDARQLRHMLFSPDAPDSAIRWLAEHVQIESQRAILDMTLANPFIQPRLVCPTLALVGDQDLLVTPDEARQADAILGTRTEVIPDMAHMLMLDGAWEQVAQRMQTWLIATFNHSSSCRPDAAVLASAP